MSWDNKKDDWNLHVRTGPSIGKASENRMLDAMGGSSTIKKRLQTNADGSVTMAHTRGQGSQPEFVTTNGSINSAVSTCSLEMDSGIADMIGSGDYDPNAILPAKVYRTAYVSAHVVTSAKAIGAGKLKFPSLEGPVVADGADAKAFPGGTRFKDRKALALHIPASLFTGRTRLYVQSLFGGNWPALVLADASNGAGRPILSVNTAARVSAGLQPALIGSGCGIYFDAVNKNHFLIQTSPTQAVVIPLLGTACAEKYRTLLRSETSLSVADQERIEAYILSQSFPNPDFATFLDHESTPSEALGYSWHFNWDGDKCDIIDVQEVWIPSASCYGFTTTHYRLEFANVGMNLSVTRSVVSGPTTWSVPKNTNVIAYPDWFQKVLWKAGNSPSVILAGAVSAKVYCFYAKNELKTVTVDTSVTPAGTSRVSSPAHYGGSYYPYPTGFLIEQENGRTVARSSGAGTQCYFSVDGVSVGGISDSSTKNTHTETWWKRMPFTEGAHHGTDWDNVSGSCPPETVNEFQNGTAIVQWFTDAIGRIYRVLTDPVPPITYTDTVYATGMNFVSMSRGFFCSFWKKEDETVSEGRSAKTLIIIPFMDAEAVYISDQNLSIEEGTATTGEISGIDVLGETYVDVIYPGGSGYVHYGHYTIWRSTIGSHARGYVTGTSGVPINRQTTTSSRHLASSQGIFTPTNMPSEGAFYSTARYVSQMYSTLSSANGAVFAEDTGVKSGANIYPHLSAYLGWA